MALVPAICTQCGTQIEVDNTKDAAICQYCRAPFVVEKAINNYNTYVTNTIHANNVIVQDGNRSSCFKIENNVLVKYTGYDEIVTIPNGIVKVGDFAFSDGNSSREYNIYVKKVNLPSSCRAIGNGAFKGCSNLKKINGLDNILEIGWSAFESCKNLKGTFVANNLKTIGRKVFKGTGYDFIDLTNVNSNQERMWSTFADTPNLKTIRISSELWKKHSTSAMFCNYDIDMDIIRACTSGAEAVYIDNVRHDYQSSIALDERMSGSALYYKAKSEAERREDQQKQQKESWKKQGLCSYCGGSFKGFFTQRCSKCGKEKNY